MKKYGYMRKKINVLSFILGICIVLLIWMYAANFTIVGRVNNEPIYRYQLKQYQKEQKFEEVNALANQIIRAQAEKQWISKKKEGESFEEYFKTYRRNADLIVY